MEAYLIKEYKKAKEELKKLKGRNKKIVTIECEWGDYEIDGDITLKHHGNKSSLPPSLFFKSNDFKQLKSPILIFSHLDADSIFGAMWACGELDVKNEVHTKISEMIAIADTKGPHAIKEDFNDELFRKWITIGLVINRNNEAEGNITDKINELFNVVKSILDTDNVIYHPFYLEAYEWYTKLRKNALQYLDVKYKHVLGFISSKFMLSNYDIAGRTRPFIIQYHTKTKRITVSSINDEIAKHVFGENGLISFMQEHFGSKAGGRPSIAGSPKDLQLSIKDYNILKKKLRDITNKKLTKEIVNELSM